MSRRGDPRSCGDLRGRPGRGDDQHDRRQRDADHVPGAAGVRLRPGGRERVEHGRARAGSVAGAIGYRRELEGSGAARCGLRSPRGSAGSPARSCCSCCPASAFKAIVPGVHRDRARARRRAAAASHAGSRRGGTRRRSTAGRRARRALPRGRLRRLLRRRAGDHHPGDPRRRAAREPAADERAEEHPRRADEPRRGGDLHRPSPTSPGARRR